MLKGDHLWIAFFHFYVLVRTVSSRSLTDSFIALIRITKLFLNS